MKHTSKYLEGYRYYVYVCPGHIEYFKTLEGAQDYINESSGTLGDVV